MRRHRPTAMIINARNLVSGQAAGCVPSETRQAVCCYVNHCRCNNRHCSIITSGVVNGKGLGEGEQATIAPLSIFDCGKIIVELLGGCIDGHAAFWPLSYVMSLIIYYYWLFIVIDYCECTELLCALKNKTSLSKKIVPKCKIWGWKV